MDLLRNNSKSLFMICFLVIEGKPVLPLPDFGTSYHVKGQFQKCHVVCSGLLCVNSSSCLSFQGSSLFPTPRSSSRFRAGSTSHQSRAESTTTMVRNPCSRRLTVTWGMSGRSSVLTRGRKKQTCMAITLTGNQRNKKHILRHIDDDSCYIFIIFWVT